ncbi:MAG: hypothetical protein HUU06_14240, partial [Planctomycetaceae bacterium]|nr:hypothetical protein [Planctomycetaceae bacterium]
MLLLLVPLLVLEAGLPAALYLARNRLLFFPDRTPAEAGRAWFGEGVEAAL